MNALGFRISKAALVMGAMTGFAPAHGQQAGSGAGQTAGADVIATTQAPQPAVDEAVARDRVVVTGSLIAVAPEDAPKPVQSFSLDDIQEQGVSTMVEFVRSLSQSTESLSDTAGGGFANANLRGLGSSGTLVLQNGRRVAPTDGFFGADLNTIPVEAMQAVEILKDGASAIYGAGAVGGVINYRTRRNVNDTTVSFERSLYSGNDGFYKLDFLTGRRTSSANFILSYSYQHEDDLERFGKDWGSYPFEKNPTQYQLSAGNPGQYHNATTGVFLSGALQTTGIAVPGAALAVPGTAAVANATVINDFRSKADCYDIGGFIVNEVQKNATGAAATGCGMPTRNLIGYFGDQTINRVYAEANFDFSDTLEFHFDIGYTSNENWSYQAPTAAPGAARRAVLGGGAVCAASCYYIIPAQVNVYNAAGQVTSTALANPFLADFTARTGAAVAPTGALFTQAQWRPFWFGGNPMYLARDSGERGTSPVRQVREQWSANAGMKGVFTDEGILGIGGFLEGISYDVNAQYIQYMNQRTYGDIYVSRLQNALLGYGGPNCNAVDRVPTDYSSAQAYNRTVGIQSDTAPGTNGCQWFNPFASAFPTAAISTGKVNPQFNAGMPNLPSNATPRPGGYQNPLDLIEWMTSEHDPQDLYQSITMDAVFSGELPDTLALPGGPILFAAGSQWSVRERTTSYDNDVEAEERMAFAQCPWPDPAVVNTPAQPAQQPGQLGCLAGGNSGAHFGTGRVTLVGQTPPAYYDSQNLAFFTELQLPVLDNLNFTAALRHEDYNNGDIVADIYSIAGKWEPVDGLYVRGSYGTNLRAEGALDLDPGFTEITTPAVARFGAGFVLDQVSTVADSIAPEESTTMNLGLGYEASFGEHRFRFAADFWEIVLQGQVITTPTSVVFNSVFGLNTASSQANRGVAGIPNTGTASTTSQFANCGSPYIAFLTFNSPCILGVTTAASLVSVRQLQQNGPDFTVNGIDYQIDWAHPLFDGDIAAAISATNVLVYKQGGYDAGGLRYDDGGDRLGWDNLSRTGDLSPEWRANATLRWSNREHTFSTRASWISGLRSEGFILGTELPTPVIAATTTAPAVYSTWGTGAGDRADYIAYDVTYIYRPRELLGVTGLEARLSVQNIEDVSPLEAQNANGYYVGLGNPRGRQLKLQLTKRF